MQEREPSPLCSFSLFSLEVLLLKSSCMKSPQRQSLWKAAQPRLTNYSSAFPLEEANVIIPFAKRECEHICSSTHPLGTPSPCKLPQLTLCHSSAAHGKRLCLSEVLLFIYSPLGRWDGPLPWPLFQVKQMSGSFGGSSPPWLCCRHSWSSPSRRTLTFTSQPGRR